MVRSGRTIAPAGGLMSNDENDSGMGASNESFEKREYAE